MSDQTLSIVLIGDVAGKSGRAAVRDRLPAIKKAFNPGLIIANGENAAGGLGLTPETAREIFAAGVDVITSGNHIWRRQEIIEHLNQDQRILRPANYPRGAPGRGCITAMANCGTPVVVMNLLGRVFMDPIDCPFRTAQRLLEAHVNASTRVVIVDFHAEATSEKMAMARYLDGRVSAVLGTHTHVPTADHHILAGGTGFQTDVGMTGCFDSVIGMQTEIVLNGFLTRLPTRFQPATGPATLCAVVVTVDKKSGRCVKITPVRLGGQLEETPLP